MGADLSYLPPEARHYLSELESRHAINEATQILDRCRELKVLVVGEAIIDEYEYCETIGKSGKEPILAARYVSSERFAGGSLAVANHAAGFCDHVGLLTFLGASNSHEEFIRSSLSSAVQPVFLYRDNAPTITKRRFVEMYPFQKLFEVYIMDCDHERTADSITESRAFSSRLRQMLPEYDIVIAADFGHGMIGTDAVEILCSEARYLAVNTQMNADNRGFNTISKYSRADYICFSENEIRLEARSRSREIKSIILEVAEKLSCPRILVTQGKRGSLGYDREEGFLEVPAFTARIVDRVGAGDAVFAVSALCAREKMPLELAGLVANAVGAEAVGIVANRSAIQRAELFDYLHALRDRHRE